MDVTDLWEKGGRGGLIREESVGSCERQRRCSLGEWMPFRNTASVHTGCMRAEETVEIIYQLLLRRSLLYGYHLLLQGTCDVDAPLDCSCKRFKMGRTQTREFSHGLPVIFSWWYELLLKNERKGRIVNTVTYWREIRGSVMYKFSKMQSQQFVVLFKSVHVNCWATFGEYSKRKSTSAHISIYDCCVNIRTIVSSQASFCHFSIRGRCAGGNPWYTVAVSI